MGLFSVWLVGVDGRRRSGSARLTKEPAPCRAYSAACAECPRLHRPCTNVTIPIPEPNIAERLQRAIFFAMAKQLSKMRVAVREQAIKALETFGDDPEVCRQVRQPRRHDERRVRFR